MVNLEQIFISVYPSKNDSKYLKSTLEHKWFLSKLRLCRTSIFTIGDLEEISISAYPSKNYSKYPKSTLEHKWFLSKSRFY